MSEKNPGGLDPSIDRAAVIRARDAVCGRCPENNDKKIVSQAVDRWLNIFRPLKPAGPGQDDRMVPNTSLARVLAEKLRALGVPASARSCAEDAFESEITTLHENDRWCHVLHPRGDGTMFPKSAMELLLERLRPMCAGFTHDMLDVKPSKGGIWTGPGFEAVWEQIFTVPHGTEACEDCGTTENVTLGPCPYASDLHGDDTQVWLCVRCSNERAKDL